MMMVVFLVSVVEEGREELVDCCVGLLVHT